MEVAELNVSEGHKHLFMIYHRGTTIPIVRAIMGWKCYFRGHPSGIPACSGLNTLARLQHLTRCRASSLRALDLPTY